MKKLISILVFLACLLGAKEAKAQAIAMRTNLAEWALYAPNLGVDLTLNDRTTLCVSLAATVKENYIHEAMVQSGHIEYRFWFSAQPYEGFFAGLQFSPTHYQIKVDHSGQKGLTHKGVATPLGFNFGYSWPLNSKFNLEACYGAGWYFYNNECSLSGASHNKTFSTTNVGVNITYIFK